MAIKRPSKPRPPPRRRKHGAIAKKGYIVWIEKRDMRFRVKANERMSTKWKVGGGCGADRGEGPSVE